MAKLIDFLTSLEITVICSDNTCVNIIIDFLTPTEFRVRGRSPNENGEYFVKDNVTFNVSDIYRHGAFAEYVRLAYIELEWNNK